jgi:hypothetical protein
MYLLNTFLGFLIAQIYDVLKRERVSQASPQAFDPIFFFKDNWVKIVLSLLLSFALSLAIHLNAPEVEKLMVSDFEVNNLIYLVVGAVPELVLQYFKRKGSFLQPKNVKGFDRK